MYSAPSVYTLTAMYNPSYLNPLFLPLVVQFHSYPFIIKVMSVSSYLNEKTANEPMQRMTKPKKYICARKAGFLQEATIKENRTKHQTLSKHPSTIQGR
ncbi:hypothetical protein GE21DRAFT_1077872 [Neurospora crassa]|nr:hypothetical protein GE21DRAFT_1077872 [Neurospora crassa]